MVLIFTSLLVFISLTSAEMTVPRRPLGFVYKDGQPTASVRLASFLDLTCPDSLEAFKILLQVADSFSDRSVQLRLYLFPLPYHTNSHLLSKAARFLDDFTKVSPSNATVFDWIQLVFSNMRYLSTRATSNSTEVEVVDYVTSLAQSLFHVSAEQFKHGIYNASIDRMTRLEWKYGATRGVYATPMFTINDVFVNGDAWNVSEWTARVDNLLQDSVHSGCGARLGAATVVNLCDVSSRESPTSDITIKSPTSDITIKSPTSDITIKSPTSDITIKSPTSVITIKSSTSDITIKSPTSVITIKSPTSDITIKSPTSDITIKSHPCQV
uniref:Thioredoxin-like fold domain-containing protein n=1 Tax=Biomphalaria glabrata TaxID=6526 RepID=A0A2C9L2P2_BIOGL